MIAAGMEAPLRLMEVSLYSLSQECIAIAAQQRQLSDEEVKSRLGQLEHLVAEVEEANSPFEIPDFLTCRIAMVPRAFLSARFFICPQIEAILQQKIVQRLTGFPIDLCCATCRA